MPVRRPDPRTITLNHCPTMPIADAHHLLLCQRFLPEHGGSIHWMHEVYRRWPADVEVVTHDYYGHPPRTPEFPDAPQRPASGDDVTDLNLRMNRRDIFLHDWGLDRPGKAMRYWRMMRAVRERLRALGRGERLVVHAIHAVPEVACLVPLKWRYGKRLRVVCYAHGEELNACASSRQLRFLLGKACGIVDRMIANSRYTADIVGRYMDPARVRVVNPGVDLGVFAGASGAGASWRREEKYEGRIVVATIGRLDPRKNQAAVVNAVADLAARFPQLIYVVAGAGRTSDQLKALARARGVGDRIVFLGAVSADLKLAIFGGCDIFAMPAVRDGPDVEGFGMVFLEAAACGKPAIAGREGGQPDAVADGQTGFVVDGNDQSAVTASLERLVADPGLRRRMGEAGMLHAQRFDWPAVVQRTVKLVEEIL